MIALLSLIWDGVLALLPYVFAIGAGYGIFRGTRGKIHQVIRRGQPTKYTFFYDVPANTSVAIDNRGRLYLNGPGSHILFPWERIDAVFSNRPASFGDDDFIYQARTSDRHQVSCRISGQGWFERPLDFLSKHPIETPSWKTIVRDELSALTARISLQDIAVAGYEQALTNALWEKLNERFRLLGWGLKVTYLSVLDLTFPEEFVLYNLERRFAYQLGEENIRGQMEPRLLDARTSNDLAAAEILERARETMGLLQRKVDAVLKLAELTSALARKELASVTNLKILGERGRLLIHLRGEELVQLSEFYERERKSIMPHLDGDAGERFVRIITATTTLSVIAKLYQQNGGRTTEMHLSSIVAGIPGIDANGILEILQGPSGIANRLGKERSEFAHR